LELGSEAILNQAKKNEKMGSQGVEPRLAAQLAALNI
jgi:hypothetical protein